MAGKLAVQGSGRSVSTNRAVRSYSHGWFARLKLRRRDWWLNYR